MDGLGPRSVLAHRRGPPASGGKRGLWWVQSRRMCVLYPEVPICSMRMSGRAGGGDVGSRRFAGAVPISQDVEVSF
jgi:hypothetical protein